MGPAAAELLSGRTVLAARNVKGSARLPVAPARRAGRRGRALGGGPTCAAAVDVGAFTAVPASHDGALEAAAASPRRGKDAAPLARLGAVVSAAAGALVPLLHVRRRLIRLLLAPCCICCCSVRSTCDPPFLPSAGSGIGDSHGSAPQPGCAHGCPAHCPCHGRRQPCRCREAAAGGHRPHGGVGWSCTRPAGWGRAA